MATKPQNQTQKQAANQNLGLIISRRRGERIIIGRGLIQITVLKIGEGRVKLAVLAPADVDVFREEIAPAGAEAEEPTTVTTDHPDFS
jgi:carbon storage regulator CsrA